MSDSIGARAPEEPPPPIPQRPLISAARKTARETFPISKGFPTNSFFPCARRSSLRARPEHGQEAPEDGLRAAAVFGSPEALWVVQAVDGRRCARRDGAAGGEGRGGGGAEMVSACPAQHLRL